jgi:hypothetical protein
MPLINTEHHLPFLATEEGPNVDNKLPMKEVGEINTSSKPFRPSFYKLL